MTSSEAEKFGRAWKLSAVKCIVVHAQVHINLAAPDDDVWKRSIARLKLEMSGASKLNIPYLVLHPGNHCGLGREKGVTRAVRGLRSALEKATRPPVRVLLETMSGQGTSLGASFGELASMLEGVDDPERVGVCLDTAHAYAAGYNMRGYEGYSNVLRELDRTVGLDSVHAVHLNDTKALIGSRKDRHAYAREGAMGLQVFHAFLTDERFREVPLILENRGHKTRKREYLSFLRTLTNCKSPIEEAPLQMLFDELEQPEAPA